VYVAVIGACLLWRAAAKWMQNHFRGGAAAAQ